MPEFTTPTWDTVGKMQEEINELHQENRLKLKQILNLEEILYNTRIIDMPDKSPCWCCMPSATDEVQGHDENCIKARSATEPHWKVAK